MTVNGKNRIIAHIVKLISNRQNWGEFQLSALVLSSFVDLSTFLLVISYNYLHLTR